MKILRAIISVLVLTVFSAAIAQQPVAPPPKPANDAPANAAVLKLLQVGMPESVVLDRIHTTTDKFDTSIDALVALKQAGATEAELKAVLAQGTAPADMPPAASPVDTGPSLAETMQFIQEKLNDIGEVSLVEFAQDLNDDSTGTGTAKYKFSNVFADQYQCRISYHWNHIQDGRIGQNENNVFSLRDVQDIVIKPLEQYLNEYDAKNGRPSIILTSTSPPISVLQIRRPHGEENFFIFTDADLADRVAKAMLHAVELCGGGNKEKF